MNERLVKEAPLLFPALSDSLLFKAYRKAVELKLDQNFIHMLHTELKLRQDELNIKCSFSRKK